ncbi:T9SS type A sorting domain-containing protein [Hymenobacter sp. HSC-4F20]|uniref:PA14 domain-containing protein n=1 Tax=Hymenobacter sp. HSC-4F20 TaxID=2864135 RepID=UPI001C73414E|nr:PA14 domain-containing protein [Hymenobacter sp. HSC-4F20]MBX0292657.1 T9SS type A sorting domain-containing protein [Hymenobacter sp. HSC-4F20]
MMKNFSAFKRWCWVWMFLWIAGGASSYGAYAQAACSGTSPDGQPATNGLYAEYFSGYFADDPGFFSDNANPASIRRVEAQVNFPNAASFGELRPTSEGTAQDPDRYSLRLRGSLNIATAGTYTFYLTADDAAYLWLDNAALALPPDPAAALINVGGTHQALTRTATITLTAGRHDVLLLYGDDCCENVLVWEYEGPGLPRQVVPTTALCTAVSSATLVPQAVLYTPASRVLPAGTTRSSAAPAVQDGGAAVTGFAIANTAELPATITINASTGVLTAAAGLAQGTYDVDVAVRNAMGTATFRNAFRFTVTPPLAGGCGGQDPAGQPASAGLYAEYFSGYFADDPTFFGGRTAGLVRTDAEVNFPNNDSFGNLLAAATGSLTDPDEFSLRQRGSLYLAAAGTYTFYLTADDAAYLWLDNAALASPLEPADATINNGGYHLSKTVAVTLELSAGLHNIALLYGDNGGNNDLVLEYESAELGLARAVVPGSLFCTATQPLLPLASALVYAPRSMRATVGMAATSVAPTVTSPSAVVEYRLANAATLPAGITIDAATGRLSVDAGVAVGTYTLDVAVRNAGGQAVFSRAFALEVAVQAPAGCAGLDGSGTVASSGLYAEVFPGYFNDDPAFFTNTTPSLRRATQAIDFGTASWGDLTGVAGGTAQNPDQFSARLRGRIQVPAAGTYTFYLTSDDASFLWLDGAALATTPTVASALINNGGLHLEATQSATVTLTAGLHDVLLLYGDNGGLNTLRLEYESAAAGVTRQLVPAGGLCTTLSNAPLPVTLTRFGVQAAKAGVVVSWETSLELNSAAFVVERSANGQVFEAVGRVAAAGTTQRRQQYTFTDRAPFSGLSYYRLRQLDQDSTAHLSDVAPVRWSKASNGLQLVLFPNPTATGTCTVRLEQAAAVPAQLQVLDLTGRLVYAQSLASSQANPEHRFSTRHLQKGVYLVRVTSAQGTVTQRLEVQ